MYDILVYSNSLKKGTLSGHVVLGTEYNLHFANNWVLTPSFKYDFKKWYDAYAIAIGIGYTF